MKRYYPVVATLTNSLEPDHVCTFSLILEVWSFERTVPYCRDTMRWVQQALIEAP